MNQLSDAKNEKMKLNDQIDALHDTIGELESKMRENVDQLECKMTEQQ